MYRDFLSANIESIRTDHLFNLLIEKEIDFTPPVHIQFINTLLSEDKKRIENPSMRTSPDWLMVTLDHCIILKLIGFDFDLSSLEPFSKYSPHLQFMFNPDSFDYSNVNIRQYMWQNLIYSEEYGPYFVQHKSEILNSDLKDIFSMALETREQQKIVYGFLLDKNELRQF